MEAANSRHSSVSSHIQLRYLFDAEQYPSDPYECLCVILQHVVDLSQPLNNLGIECESKLLLLLGCACFVGFQEKCVVSKLVVYHGLRSLNCNLLFQGRAGRYQELGLKEFIFVEAQKTLLVPVKFKQRKSIVNIVGWASLLADLAHNHAVLELVPGSQIPHR